MKKEDREYNRMIEEELTKIRGELRPDLDGPLPTPGNPSPGLQAMMERHVAVIEMVAKARKAGEKRRRKA